MTAPPAAPLTVPAPTIEPGWIDYNGHLNVAYYLKMFDEGLDLVMTEIGLTHDRIQETGQSLFALEAHLVWKQELHLGDRAVIDWQLLDHDGKKMHCFMTMRHADHGFVAAHCEQMLLHVSLATRKSAPFAPDILARIAAYGKAHATLARPPEAGRSIAIRKTAQ